MTTVHTGSHWGIYEVDVADGHIRAVRPSPHDPDPTPLHRALPDIVNHACRVRFPAVRQGFLENGYKADRTSRGAEPFVRVSWDHALDLVAAEIERVKREHGNESIFAGSYGWASSGRLHHPRTSSHLRVRTSRIELQRGQGLHLPVYSPKPALETLSHPL